MSDEPLPVLAPNVLRHVTVRGLVFGALLAPALGIPLQLEEHVGFGAAIAGFFLGLILGGIALVEVVAVRWPASLRRDLAAAAIAALVALPCLFLGAFQVGYTMMALKKGSLDAGLAAIPETLDLLLEKGFTYPAIFGFLMGAYGALTLARLRRLSFARELLVVLVGAFFAGFPGLILFHANGHMAVVAPMFAIVAILLPVGARVADALERRVTARLEAAP
jgi:hypothetical protein